MPVPKTPRLARNNSTAKKPPLDPHDPLCMVRKAELASLLSINVFTLDGWRRRGLIPQPIRLSGQVLVWRRSDVANWLAQREVQPAPERSYPTPRKRAGGAA